MSQEKKQTQLWVEILQKRSALAEKLLLETEENGFP